MAAKKTQVPSQAQLPETDGLVGERKSTAALSEATARRVRRRRLLEMFSQAALAWNPADHPDIEGVGGAAAWVRKLRREADKASSRRMRAKRG